GRARCDGAADEHATSAADHRWHLRRGDALGDGADRQLPLLPSARVPHGAVAPSLRAAWLAGDDGDHPLLDRRRARDRDGRWAVLRRLPVDPGGPWLSGRW